MSNHRRCSHRRQKKSDDKLSRVPSYINLIIAILNLITAILLKLDN